MDTTEHKFCWIFGMLATSRDYKNSERVGRTSNLWLRLSRNRIRELIYKYVVIFLGIFSLEISAREFEDLASLFHLNAVIKEGFRMAHVVQLNFLDSSQ